MAKGDVVFIDIPQPAGSAGHEQTGLRPGIIMSVDGSPVHRLITVIPLTSKLRAERFRYTIRIEPTKENGLSVPSIALVFQLSSYDQSRIVRVIGRLEQEYLIRIDAMLKDMLGL